MPFSIGVAKHYYHYTPAHNVPCHSLALFSEEKHELEELEGSTSPS